VPQRLDYSDGTKICPKCGAVKPLSAFYATPAGRPKGRCKACFSATRPRYKRQVAPSDITCAHCGEVFRAEKRADQAKYCSRRCAQTGWERARGRRPLGIVIIDGKRQCGRCDEWKVISQFASRKDRRGQPVSQCRQCAAAAARIYNGGDRGRNKRYANKYGVTIEWYESKLAEQKGVCAICGRPPDSGSKMHPRLAIDHVHSTGIVRGLLCFLCNSALGKFKDDPALLMRAIAYIDHHRRIGPG